MFLSACLLYIFSFLYIIAYEKVFKGHIFVDPFVKKIFYFGVVMIAIPIVWRGTHGLGWFTVYNP